MSTRYTYEQPEYLDVEGAKFLVAEIKEYIDLKLTGGVDLSTYATKEYVDEAVSDVDVDLSNYYTKAEVDTLIANIPTDDSGNGDSGNEEGGGDTPTPSTVTLAISGNTSLKYGFERTYKAVYTDGDSNDVTSNYTTTWSITPNGFDASEIQMDTSTANQVVLLTENEDLAEETFTLTATPSDATISPASIEITITEPF